jgi:hypothetical protein
MKVISKPCPISFCEEFTKQELFDLKENEIWNSWHPVMERLLSRSVEMKPVYFEIFDKLGCSLDFCSPELRLTLEAIWASGKLFNQDTISHKRKVQKELSQLHMDIPRLTSELSKALIRQRELQNTEDFRLGKYISLVGLISLAGKSNGHYSGWIDEELKKLDDEYDGKYWPEPEDLITAIGDFESSRDFPTQGYLPEEVMSGRKSIIKDFVLGLDSDIYRCREIPISFSFSNASMASIANVVLDLQADTLATAEAVRVIRNRSKNGSYEAVI